MAFNAINKLPQNVFTGLFRLRNLDLSNNQIEELNNSVFSACQELQYLDLSHNKLTELSPEVFSGIPALQVHKYIIKVERVFHFGSNLQIKVPDHYSEHLNTLLCKALKRVIWHLYLSQSEKPSETNPPLISQVMWLACQKKGYLICDEITNL